MGPLHYLGMDTTPLPGTLQAYRIKKKHHKRIWQNLLEMAAEARKILNEGD